MRFTLQQLGLLDAPLEVEFDNITSLAAELLRVPVAHVSILDQSKKRIFYKSHYGHVGDLAEHRQLPMDQTYCQHVALTQQPVIVVDSRTHELLAGTPAQQDDVLAYLGLPISTPDGEVVGGLCMMQPDVREWTEREVASAKKLAACVSDLIRLKAAMLTSEQLRKEQREFTYAISHDLKSPANTLRMVLKEVTLEKKKLSDDVQYLVGQGMVTVERMAQQVEDVLKYSRTVDVVGEVETISMSELIDEIWNDVIRDKPAKNAQIRHVDLPDIIADRLQIRALFFNLIGNALKFCPAGRDPLIEVSAEYDKEFGEHSIRVKDNGIGIAREDQTSVFSLFTRLHLQEVYSGSGVGLALCQRAAQNHNGSIAVESDGKNGSVFIVNIPDQPL